ncbi:antitoxin MazE-like protein [Reyranella sp.]|uniref:antitoxin MazE-like protein n=1 Tax=Reyranella sp. TaxID=1929291 RepID=UPI003BABE54F
MTVLGASATPKRRGFAAECRRQARLAAESDRGNGALMRFMDMAFDDLPDGDPSSAAAARAQPRG